MNDHTTPIPGPADGGADRLRDMVKGQRFVMLTTSEPAGRLVSRPMTVAEFDEAGWVLRFITQRRNDVAVHGADQQVNIAIIDGGDYVSLSGTGRMVDDVAQKQELWGRLMEAYAGEATDPENVILDVVVDSGEYWDAGNPIVRVLGLAKAAITKDAPNGDHDKVQL